MIKKKAAIPVLVIACILVLSVVYFRQEPTAPGDKKPAAPEKELRVENGVVEPGQVLGNILRGTSLPGELVQPVAETFGEIFDVRAIRPGDRWELSIDKENGFFSFVFRNSPLYAYQVKRKPGEKVFYASRVEEETSTALLSARGNISSSLYRDMTKIGLSAGQVIQFAEIFSSRIDFFNDPREGDDFLAVWETVKIDDRPVKHRHFLAAAYQNAGKEYRAYYFECPEGRQGYFDSEGHSLESAFLSAPLEYRRISSHFTHRRLHPIHRVYRPHLGIDYAAPEGTPVSAIGAGRVSFVGWRTCGFGNTIIIDHPNGYSSYYGHLSRFARGLRSGQRVSRGQLVGYVGATGTATGPHLDFRLREKRTGKFINFLSLDLPPAFELEEGYRQLFEARREELDLFLEKAGREPGQKTLATKERNGGKKVAGTEKREESLPWWRIILRLS